MEAADSPPLSPHPVGVLSLGPCGSLWLEIDRGGSRPNDVFSVQLLRAALLCPWLSQPTQPPRAPPGRLLARLLLLPGSFSLLGRRHLRVDAAMVRVLWPSPSAPTCISLSPSPSSPLPFPSLSPPSSLPSRPLVRGTVVRGVLTGRSPLLRLPVLSGERREPVLLMEMAQLTAEGSLLSLVVVARGMQALRWHHLLEIGCYYRLSSLRLSLVFPGDPVAERMAYSTCSRSILINGTPELAPIFQSMFVHRSSHGKSTTIPSYPFPSSTPIFACRTKSALVSYIGQITAVIAPLAYELDHGEYLLLLSHSPASVQSLHPLQLGTTVRLHNIHPLFCQLCDSSIAAPHIIAFGACTSTFVAVHSFPAFPAAAPCLPHDRHLLLSRWSAVYRRHSLSEVAVIMQFFRFFRSHFPQASRDSSWWFSVLDLVLASGWRSSLPPRNVVTEFIDHHRVPCVPSRPSPALPTFPRFPAPCLPQQHSSSPSPPNSLHHRHPLHHNRPAARGHLIQNLLSLRQDASDRSDKSYTLMTQRFYRVQRFRDPRAHLFKLFRNHQDGVCYATDLTDMFPVILDSFWSPHFFSSEATLYCQNVSIVAFSDDLISHEFYLFISSSDIERCLGNSPLLDSPAPRPLASDPDFLVFCVVSCSLLRREASDRLTQVVHVIQLRESFQPLPAELLCLNKAAGWLSPGRLYAISYLVTGSASSSSSSFHRLTTTTASEMIEVDFVSSSVSHLFRSLISSDPCFPSQCGVCYRPPRDDCPCLRPFNPIRAVLPHDASCARRVARMFHSGRNRHRVSGTVLSVVRDPPMLQSGAAALTPHFSLMSAPASVILSLAVVYPTQSYLRIRLVDLALLDPVVLIAGALINLFHMHPGPSSTELILSADTGVQISRVDFLPQDNTGDHFFDDLALSRSPTAPVSEDLVDCIRNLYASNLFSGTRVFGGCITRWLHFCIGTACSLCGQYLELDSPDCRCDPDQKKASRKPSLRAEAQVYVEDGSGSVAMTIPSDLLFRMLQLPRFHVKELRLDTHRSGPLLMDRHRWSFVRFTSSKHPVNETVAGMLVDQMRTAAAQYFRWTADMPSRGVAVATQFDPMTAQQRAYALLSQIDQSTNP